MTIAQLLTDANQRVLALEQSQTVYHSGMTAQTRLLAQLIPLFPEGNVYPDTAHEQRSFPDCVYSVNDTGSLQYRGVDMSHSALFGLSLRHSVQADLVEKFDALAEVLHQQSGIEVIGYATGFEENTADGGNYVIGVEVLISHPIGFDAQSPQPYALLTLPGQESGVEGRYDNCGTQAILREHHVIYHSNTQADLKSQRHTTQQALHFKRLPDAFRPLEYVKGEPLKAEGGLLAWVDVWRDTYRMQPTQHP
ncbi:MAG: hypothetical protein R3F02_18720 [Thiolinea sp.]